MIDKWNIFGEKKRDERFQSVDDELAKVAQSKQ